MENFSHNQKEEANQLVIDYLFLRKALGVLGVTFPIILVIGSVCKGSQVVQSSMSSYYYTGMRDFFVGALFSMGLFLFSYKGYTSADNLSANLGGIGALGIALFPCGYDEAARQIFPLTSIIHYVSTALFLSVMMYFCFVLFQKSNIEKCYRTGSHHKQKNKRNVVYKVCGFVMLVCLLVLISIGIFRIDEKSFPLEFCFESVALIAFGISWLTKGEMILKDLQE